MRHKRPADLPPPPPQDYHLPVEGGSGPPPRGLHVVHIAVEMAPIAKARGCVYDMCVAG